MSSHSAVVDEREISPAHAGNGVPVTIFNRFIGVVRNIRRNNSEIALPVKVRETRYAALATTGFAFMQGLLALPDGVDGVLGSAGHFLAAWLTGGVALLFGLRAPWVWVAALGLASLQAFFGVFTLVSAEMPTGVSPFGVLIGIMASGTVLALLLRKDCYGWFNSASPEL
ncbi:hypothetical protein [Nocardia sp.]|uniref:hypothetical protein n=1 Tax=Nocardia sp. TaxID=1821 RepID=UPI002623880C|nr:hypothetical protein [Nocardia sp.]